MPVVKRSVLFLILLSIVCGGAAAEKRNASVALSIGAFFPQSSSTRDTFGSAWSRVSVNLFDTTKPDKWMFSPEISSYRLSGSTSAQLYPLTFGVERGLNKSTKAQPYVTLRAGPYYGRVNNDTSGLHDDRIGLNANAAFGVVFARHYYVEARYDHFSGIAGFDFSGFSVSAGIRLFDVRL